VTTARAPRWASGAGRDLVTAVRAELAALEPTRRCCQAAERDGLGQAAQGRARSPQIGRLAVRLASSGRPATFSWPAAAGHCRVAWLRGLVLARGSLSIGASGTHLELVVLPEELAEVSARLTDIGLAFGVRMRRGRGVITWKDAATVLDLLRLIGVSSAALEIESRFVGRELRSHLNRVINAENANLARAVAAAHRQLADIDKLEHAGALRRMPSHVRRVASARRRAPEATLAELALAVDLSRGQVQRAFERISDAALHAAGDAM
jgi:DNA-binding transcriptional regulator WhiA